MTRRKAPRGRKGGKADRQTKLMNTDTYRASAGKRRNHLIRNGDRLPLCRSTAVFLLSVPFMRGDDFLINCVKCKEAMERQGIGGYAATPAQPRRRAKQRRGT